MGEIKDRFRLKSFRKCWRKLNTHNETYANSIFPIDKVTVGNYTYGGITALFYGQNNEMLKIGNCCSIASEVTFLCGGNHTLNTLSSFPFKNKLAQHDLCEAYCKGPIVIDDDVWIGYRSTILSGIHIGQGAVIAACSVVTNDVPAYAIVGGNPAKIIKYRFKNETIEELLKLDFSKLNNNIILQNIEKFYCPIEDSEYYKWFPYK